MLNKVDYLLSVIRREIPGELLDYVFCKPVGYLRITPSLDYILKLKILNEWVLRDCNVVSGKVVTLPLSSSYFTEVTGGVRIEIPLPITEGREITSLLSLSYGGVVTGQTGGATLMGVVKGINRDTTANMELVGPNVILLKGPVTSGQLHLECSLAIDDTFNMVSVRALHLLARIAVMATKAFLYTELRVKVASGLVINGVSYPGLDDVISEYGDSIELYNEMIRTDWSKMSYITDSRAHRRLINVIASGR